MCGFFNRGFIAFPGIKASETWLGVWRRLSVVLPGHTKSSQQCDFHIIRAMLYIKWAGTIILLPDDPSAVFLYQMHFQSCYMWSQWQGCWLGFSRTAHNTISRGIQMFVFCSSPWRKGSHVCRRACWTSASREWFPQLAALPNLLCINQNFTALRCSFTAFVWSCRLCFCCFS